MMDKAFLLVEKKEFRLVYMYGKEIREGNKKEKGNKRGKQEGKGVETRGKGNKKGNEREMRKLSDCSPFNIQ